MGYAVSWVAVKAPGDEVLESLGLVRTDETEEVPESPLCFMESTHRLYICARGPCGFRAVVVGLTSR
jgi:hypothetical protein